MRRCLSPFFIGREELGLDRGTAPFDVILPNSLVGPHSGSKIAINRINLAIREFVAATIMAGDKPLVLSGDCLSCIGCLAGVEATGIRPHLLWFDAHGDFHTPQTTISGHLGGMPLAMITGRGDLSLLDAVGLTPFPDENVCHIGARALEAGEKEAFVASRICRIDRLTEVLEELPKRPPLWVHFDTDYINPNDAPAMRYPAAGGVPAQVTKSDFDALRQTVSIVGISISAWAPHLDTQTKTAAICWDCISDLAAT